MRRISSRLGVLLLIVALVACSDYQNARRAYERGDYALAIKQFETLANQGNTEARFDLAHMYFQGIGVAADNSKAWHYLISAAEAGNTDAMVEAAMRYASGIGVGQNLIMAARWYRRAAKLGDPIAAYNLASMHEAGTEVSKDPIRAYAWYLVAMKNGNRAARERLDGLRSNMLYEDVQKAESLSASMLHEP